MISSLPTIAKVSLLLREGEITPLDLVEFCLAQIERYDGPISAWVQLDGEGARRRAEQLGERIERGEAVGPLAGIPIGVKDIVDVAHMPTKAASPLREDHLAEKDAPLVARLRAAGAILLGKTVTTEFACFDPPPTRNPWNLNHTPGGSSSGSAAAVAAEMCMGAVGSQTGGSITRPATYCGVAGLKPTFGAVSTEGVVPLSYHLDHPGPIAASVQDLASLFFAMSQPPSTADATQKTVDELFDKLDSDTKAGAVAPLPYLGVMDGFFFDEADPSVRQTCRDAIETLRQAGAVVGQARLPRSFDEVHAMHRRIMAVEAAMTHRRHFAVRPEAFGPHVTSLIHEGLATAAIDYAAALEHQRQFQHEVLGLFTQGNVVVMPATNSTAPEGLETTGDPKFNSPWSYAGLPAASIPCGLADNSMPCGLQFIGPPHSEPLVLYAAAWCERKLNFSERPFLHE